MTNKELQELLQKYPDNILVYKHSPVEGDSENCQDFSENDLLLDDRYPAIILMI